MLKLLTFALLALFAIAATALDSEGWHTAEATVMDYSLAKRQNAAEITYYEGEDLKNAACYGRNGLKPFNAKPSDFIAAMWMRNLEFCYQCIEVRSGKKKVKTITVKVIDKCAGCPTGKKNVDLTRTAFEKLAPLSEGRVAIQWRPIPKCPQKGAWPTYESKGRKMKTKRNKSVSVMN